jgi:hypothetical protein
MKQMNLKLIYLTATITMLAISCSNNYDFWDISKFRMDNNALKDNEEIKLLYTSRGPDNNKKLEYYIHVIAVSQKTGDTVNILTTFDNGFEQGDKDKVYNFFDQNNIASKITHMNTDDIVQLKNVDDIENKQIKVKISKVARDPNFDYLADNDFPTVIGAIGTYTPNQEE